MNTLKTYKTYEVKTITSSITKRVELHERETYWAIKVFNPEIKQPIKVHTGNKAYINKLYKEYGKLRFY